MLAAALLVMPLHGIAATLTVLLCHGDAQAHAAHAGAGHDHTGHDHDGHPQPSTHQHGHGDPAGSDDSSAGSAFHLCCNLTASVPPSTSIVTQLPEFPVRALAPEILHDLFVPELPQRPPLA